MKTIELSSNEKIWILLCKGWIMKKYPISKKHKTFVDYIKPYFAEVYGWTAEDFEEDFKRCIFNVLFDIFMKVREDFQHDSDIKEIISIGCFKSLSYDDEDSMLRVIRKIRGEIAVSRVTNEDGTKRYDVKTEMDLFIKNN
jgi:hypothetical protein